MKRILTITTLLLLSFWACNKQEHTLNIVAPLQAPEPIDELATVDTLEAKKQELFSRLHSCSMRVALANQIYYAPKRQVEARTALYPIHEN